MQNIQKIWYQFMIMLMVDLSMHSNFLLIIFENKTREWGDIFEMCPPTPITTCKISSHSRIMSIIFYFLWLFYFCMTIIWLKSLCNCSIDYWKRYDIVCFNGQQLVRLSHFWQIHQVSDEKKEIKNIGFKMMQSSPLEICLYACFVPMVAHNGALCI